MKLPVSGIWQHASTNRSTAVLSVITLLILLTAIPLTVLVSRQQQTLKQHAAGASPQISIAPSACGSSPTDTVIIIDKSGSMLGDKITGAKSAASSFVDILSQNPQDKVALITFSTTATTDVPFTTNYSSVKSKINLIYPFGSTCLQCAIKQAEAQMQSVASDGNKKVVVVLTDGIANSIAENVYGTKSIATAFDGETKVLGASTTKLAQVVLPKWWPTGYPVPSGYTTPTPSPARYTTPSLSPVPSPTGSFTNTLNNIFKNIFPTKTPLPTGSPNPTGEITNSGGNTTQSIAEQAALNEIKSAYATYQSPFYTIGLGGDVNTDFLKQISSDTGGQYNFSPTGSELTSIYNNISQVIGKGSITGFDFLDTNGNGVYDQGEQKLADYPVILTKTATGETVAETTSSSSGEFTVNNICDGSYTLTSHVPSDNTGGTPLNLVSHPNAYTITVTKGSSLGDKNFAFSPPTGSGTPTPTCTPYKPVCPTGPTGTVQCDAVQAPPPGGWCPSITPVASPSPTCTPPEIAVQPGGWYCGTTPTINPTATPGPNDTQISLTVLLHGIGAAGDNVSTASSMSNQNPLHPQRGVNVQVFNTSNQMVADMVGTINYSSASGSFKGIVDLGANFTTGSYNVRVKTDQYLGRLLPGIQTITAGQTNTLPSVTLIAGDTDNNNALNILDYNTIINCYSDFAPAKSCTPAQKQQADINDDGKVDQTDYNLFLRELTVHYGQ